MTQAAARPLLSTSTRIEVIYDHVILVLKGVSLAGAGQGQGRGAAGRQRRRQDHDA